MIGLNINAQSVGAMSSAPGSKLRAACGNANLTFSTALKTAAADTVRVSTGTDAGSISDSAKAFADFTSFSADQISAQLGPGDSRDERQQFKIKLAQDAAAVSLTQGLPVGQYDFTDMSEKQLHAVINDQIVNRGLSMEDSYGMVRMIIPQENAAGKMVFSDTPKNYLAAMQDTKEDVLKSGEIGWAQYIERSLNKINHISANKIFGLENKKGVY